MAHSHNHNHAHGHDHGHDHDHMPTITRENERKVLLSFWLIATFMVVEVVGGLLSGSLALLADAGHMLTDAAALALAYAGLDSVPPIHGAPSDTFASKSWPGSSTR